jgi:hypothetical protein
MPVRFQKEEPSKVRFEKEDIKLGETPYGESILRGAAQGASFGFSDELEGGAKAAYETAFGDKKLDDFKKTYQTERDLARSKNEKAAEDNPALYTGSEITAGVASSFIPGMGILNAGKGATTAVKLGKAAATGGLAGLGLSNADLTKGDVGGAIEDTAMGAGTGALVQGAFTGAGKLAKNLTPTNVAKKAAKVLTQTPEEVTETYIKNREGVKNAATRMELAKKFGGTLEDLKEQVISGSKESRDILDSEALTFKGSDIADQLDPLVHSLKERSEGVWDDPKRNAVYDYLKSIQKSYRPKPEVPPEPSSSLDNLLGIKEPVKVSKEKEFSANRIKDLVQTLQNNADYSSSAGEIKPIDTRISKEAAGIINNYLKDKSPAYANHMKQVAKDSSLLENASSIGSEKSLPNIFRRLETDKHGAGQLPRETIEALDKRMGTDYLRQIPLSMAKETFDKSVTNGSRNVNLYKTIFEEIGKKLNLPFTPALGAAVGATVDKYGPKLTQGAVDMAAAIEKKMNSGDMKGYTVFAKAVANKVKQGDPAARLTYILLSERNPDLINHLKEEK